MVRVGFGTVFGCGYASKGNKQKKIRLQHFRMKYQQENRSNLPLTAEIFEVLQVEEIMIPRGPSSILSSQGQATFIYSRREEIKGCLSGLQVGWIYFKLPQLGMTSSKKSCPNPRVLESISECLQGGKVQDWCPSLGQYLEKPYEQFQRDVMACPSPKYSHLRRNLRIVRRA